MVDLTDDERSQLEALTRCGVAPVRSVAHARVLLLADAGQTDWTLQLLAEELVQREVVPAISYETIRRELKKVI